MSDRVFVDTNVLLYAHDVDAGRKHEVAAAFVADLWAKRRGVISTQVLQEFYVNVTRKIPKPLSPQRARQVVEAYVVWEVAQIDARDVVRASEVEERERLSFWDALIVVAAVKSGAARLASEDFTAGRLIEGVRIENPFGKAKA
jgi:predicted nucleic acid-binding protein